VSNTFYAETDRRVDLRLPLLRRESLTAGTHGRTKSADGTTAKQDSRYHHQAGATERSTIH
jgi:hypothetical protein